MLASGYLLVIDYGYTARELARFPEGTLMMLPASCGDGKRPGWPGNAGHHGSCEFRTLT